MQHLTFDKERVIHSLKTAFACLIGFCIAKVMHLPAGQWLVITILVVMCAQINVGSMLQKSYMRFLGTLLGSLIAISTLLFLGTNTTVIAIIIVLSAMGFSYIATSQTNYNESGTLGVVTAAIILSSPNPTFAIGIERFLEISGGILIAALVSQFVLPIHARDLLRRNQAKTLKQLRAYYFEVFLHDKKKIDSKIYIEIDVEMTKSIMAQRKLAAEAAREPFARKSPAVVQFNKLLWCEREILRSITFMRHAYEDSTACKKIFSSPEITHQFHDKICDALDKIAEHLQDNTRKKLTVEIPSTTILKNIILPETQTLSAQDITYTNAYLFSAEIIVTRLKELVNLIN